MTLILNGTNGLSDVDGSAATPAIRGTDANTGIFFPAADTIGFAEGGVEAMRIDSNANLQFNSGYGSVATAYGCRAWVNFNGTGTVAIRASGNVTSITDNGTGDYTLNFTTAMPDANYSVIPMRWYATDDAGKYAQILTSSVDGYLTTSGCRVRNLNPGVNLYDSGTVCVAIFR